MKKSFNLMLSASLLCGAVTMIGCSEAPKSEPAPAATPAAVATPAAAPAQGDITKVKTSLESALTALKAKNYVEAVSAVDSASKELSAVADNSKLPEAVKATINRTNENLTPIKALLEKKDAGAEKSLTATLASVSNLTTIVSAMTNGGAGEMIKSVTAGAAGAVGTMMKGAVTKTNEAAGEAKSTTDKAGEMMQKKK